MREQGPIVQVVVRDRNGTVVNRVDGPTSAGMHRVAWDLEMMPNAQIEPGQGGGFGGSVWALPGTYKAELIKVEGGEVAQLAGPVEFEVVPLYEGALERKSPDVVASFRQELESFQLVLERAGNTLEEQIDRVEAMQTALSRADDPDPTLNARLYQTRLELLELRERLEGSEARGQIGERGPITPSGRLFVGYRGLSSTYGPTETHRQAIAAGQAELAPIRAEIERFADEVVPELMRAVEATGAPPIAGGG